MSLDFEVSPGGAIRGQLRVPGDKSISHRSVMLASIAEGRSEVNGFLEGEEPGNAACVSRDGGAGNRS